MKKTVILGLLFIVLINCGEFKIQDNVVSYDNLRFTVLSSGLIAVKPDSSASGPYNFTSTDYKMEVRQKANRLHISTGNCQLIYSKGANPLVDRIQLQFTQNGQTITTGINSPDKQSLGGVIRSVDRFDGRLEYEQYNLNSDAHPVKIPKGLLSRRGWTVLKNVDGKLVHGDRKQSSEELFIFCYGNDYKAALRDFTNLNGKIPLLPKWTDRKSVV